MTAHTDEQQPPAGAIPDAIPDTIPWDTALHLCATLQAENRHKWYTPNGMMCRGCVRFSAGNPAKRCLANRPDNRGCYQVNARYDAQRLPA
jgi:hypothetical protein